MPSYLPARARPWPHAGTRLRPGRLAGLVHHAWYMVDPMKLKYLAIAVMTAASTVVAKNIGFLEHVSPGCCGGIASIVPVSWSASICPYQASRIFGKLFKNNVHVLTHGVSSLRKVCLPCDLLFPRLSLYRRTNRQTDRIVNYSNSRCAYARGLIMWTTPYKGSYSTCCTFEDVRLNS